MISTFKTLLNTLPTENKINVNLSSGQLILQSQLYNCPKKSVKFKFYEDMSGSCGQQKENGGQSGWLEKGVTERRVEHNKY